MWTEIWHTILRQPLHMAGACLVQTIAYHILRYIQRKLRKNPKLDWIGSNDKPVMLISGILPFFIAFWREPADVAAGGWLAKSYVDGINWLSWGLVSAYEKYRTKYKD